MSSRRLRRLKLPQHVHDALEREELLTCQDLLSHNRLELLQLLDADIEDIDNLLLTASQATAPKSKTLLEMKEMLQFQEQHFATGIPALDQLLLGGIPVATLTEFSGAAGSGKTQFCITLSVMAALQGFGVIYIDTEGSFHVRRLLEIAHGRNPMLSEEEQTSIAQSVHIIPARGSSELLQSLQALEGMVIENGAKLVVIDSIAAAARRDGSSLQQRQDMLSREAALLKRIAEGFSIPIVVTNQITTLLRPTASEPAGEYATDEDANRSGQIIPALGNTWSHCVTTRILLTCKDDARHLIVAKSPLTPMAQLEYKIAAEGIVDLGNAEILGDLGTDSGHFTDVRLDGAYNSLNVQLGV